VAAIALINWVGECRAAIGADVELAASGASGNNIIGELKG
jgi:hypothetical protein